MSVMVELSDEQATALTARAAAQGLTLERWLRMLADEEVAGRPSASGAPTGSKSGLVQRMQAIRARVKPDPEGWTTRDYVNYGRR